MEGNRGPDFSFLQVFGNCLHDVIKVFRSVVVLALLHWEVDLPLLILVEWIKVICFRDHIVDIGSYCECRFIQPASRHILYGISSPTKHNNGRPVRKHMLYCFPMPLNGQIQVSQFIFRQRISPTLNNHNIRTIRWHTLLHYLFKQIQINFISDTSFQGHIYAKKFTNTFTDGIKSSGSREKILLELVKAHSHHSVCV